MSRHHAKALAGVGARCPSAIFGRIGSRKRGGTSRWRSTRGRGGFVGISWCTRTGEGFRARRTQCSIRGAFANARVRRCGCGCGCAWAWACERVQETGQLGGRRSDQANCAVSGTFPSWTHLPCPPACRRPYDQTSGCRGSSMTSS